MPPELNYVYTSHHNDRADADKAVASARALGVNVSVAKTWVGTGKRRKRAWRVTPVSGAK